MPIAEAAIIGRSVSKSENYFGLVVPVGFRVRNAQTVRIEKIKLRNVIAQIIMPIIANACPT